MTQTEALKLALEALIKTQNEGFNLPGSAIREAITAIKEALMSQSDGAQPAVAEQHKQELFLAPNNFYKDVDEAINKLDKNGSIFDGNDSAPYVVWLLRTLRELVAQTQPKEPEQEPVAWLHWLHGPVRLFLNKDEAMMELDRLNREYPVDKDARQMKPLYTTPPQLKPLTIDQIASIAIDRSKPDGIVAFVRAIEAAHGIKE